MIDSKHGGHMIGIGSDEKNTMTERQDLQYEIGGNT